MSEKQFEPYAGTVYRLMRDAYYGDGGFKGGYLIQHKRELPENYQARQQAAYYMNYFAPIVNALVDPVFKRSPLRDWKGSASTIIKAFVKNVDGTGTDMDAFMKQAALSAKLYGAVFLVVENFQSMDLPPTMGQALQERKFPYAYTLDPDRVESCTIDKNGRVLSIKFRDMAVASTRGEQLERTIYFDEQHWSILENGVQVSAGEHNLGEVPVVFFPSQKVKSGEINPTPELYPIAGIAKSLYNHCSWLTEILRNQTFPVLTFPSKEATDLVIGSNNALCYDGDTVKFQPGFISPPSDSAQMLQSQIKMLIEEMYRMAGLSFVTGTRQESSGIARQWEFERTNQRLSEFAKRCSMTERKMVMKVARWMGLDIDYTATYSSDFGVTDISTELKNAQAVLDMDLSPELRVEVAKQVMGAYLPELSAERFDEIVGSIGEDGLESEYSEPPAGKRPAGFEVAPGEEGMEPDKE